jgi:DNA-directed RNA polymerase subunit H (RpoH/RPB5)
MSSRIVSIFKSRRILLEQLSQLEYNTTDYATFTVNEIDAMLSSSQLDMLLEHEKSGRKVYIKYPRLASSRNIQQRVLDELVEDLFVMEDVLTREDALILMIEDEPNDSLLAKLRTMWDRDGIFIVAHNMQRLQFNLLKHALVPKMTALDGEETQTVMDKYNIKDKKQFPEISRFDPQALAIMLRPGQIAEIERSSPTALSALYYRVCV